MQPQRHRDAGAQRFTEESPRRSFPSAPRLETREGSLVCCAIKTVPANIQSSKIHACRMKNFLRIVSALLIVSGLLVASASFAAAQDDPPFCQIGRFKPCTCAEAVPEEVHYWPVFPACGNRAAILLRGRFLNVFSVVVRDNQNRDRWPTSGFNRCSFRLANSANPPARCSAFKVQSSFVYEDPNLGLTRVNCLGAAGTSNLFRNVVRITAKLQDVPGSNADPLKRWCLFSPAERLN